MSTGKLRKSTGIANACAWLPWAAYVLAWSLARPEEMTWEAPGAAALGVALSWVLLAKVRHWERWALATVAVQVAWLIYAYVKVIGPARAQSACVPCSFLNSRFQLADVLVQRGNFRWAFEVAWNDVVLPATIVGTAIIMAFCVARKP